MTHRWKALVVTIAAMCSWQLDVVAAQEPGINEAAYIAVGGIEQWITIRGA